MLRVISFNENFEELIEIDSYIPIKAIWKPLDLAFEHPPPFYYYRIQGNNRQLLEIKLNKKGFLKSISLVLHDNLKFEKERDKREYILVGKGVPLFDISKFNKKYIWDVKNRFFVLYDEESVHLLIDSRKEIVSLIETKGVRFFLDSEQFIKKISFINLNCKEYEKCIDALKFKLCT